jgi:N utilization substance protein A
MAVSANRLELLQIADAVAREKSIDRGIVIAAMEDAIQKAARSRYGSETEVRAEINPRPERCGCRVASWWSSRSTTTQSTSAGIRRRNSAAQVGDYIVEQPPPLRAHRRPVGQAGDRRRCARPSATASTRNSDRIGDIVNGIGGWNTATPSSTSAAARRSCGATIAAARGVPQRRLHHAYIYDVMRAAGPTDLCRAPIRSS